MAEKKSKKKALPNPNEGETTSVPNVVSGQPTAGGESEDCGCGCGERFEGWETKQNDRYCGPRYEKGLIIAGKRYRPAHIPTDQTDQYITDNPVTEKYFKN